VGSWNPTQYGTFLDWRTRPARDLVQRVNLNGIRTIVDLGCGPGNSTAVCAERWPDASITGIDSSAEMIATARALQPDRRWIVGDIGDWSLQPPTSGEPLHLIFSSAALQWIDDHATLFPRLISKLSKGGALAVQMPAYDAVPNQLMREVAASSQWRHAFPDGKAKEWRSHSLEFYYNILQGCVKSLDLWATEYLQIMPDVGAIVEWYKSTGLRPYLESLGDEGQRLEFIREYQSRLEAFYMKLEDGCVPFLFRRLFIVAGV
jgi:trans-aconitate 2-methyltransferase